jgi:hypothetical protein
MVVAPTFYASQLLTCYDYELIVYMDDILIASFMDEAPTQGLFDLLTSLFFEFGVSLNFQKSVLTP